MIQTCRALRRGEALTPPWQDANRTNNPVRDMSSSSKKSPNGAKLELRVLNSHASLIFSFLYLSYRFPLSVEVAESNHVAGDPWTLAGGSLQAWLSEVSHNIEDRMHLTQSTMRTRTP